MTTTTASKNGFRELHEQFTATRGAGAPDWVKKLRTQGIAHYEEHGLPTLRDEDWRFTSLAPVSGRDFTLGNGDAAVSRKDLERFLIPGLAGPRLVFVDGRFVPGLSEMAALPTGVEVLPMAEALTSRREALEPHLDRLARSRPEALTALNTAFLEDGFFVNVPAGTVVPGAIHALFVASPGASSMAHPRNLILVGRTAEVSVVEDYVSLDETPTLTNAVTEAVVSDGATCNHYVLERENEAAASVTTLHAEQGRDAKLHSHSALLGGGLVRNNVYPVLNGENGWTLLNGFYVPHGEQHHDTFMVVHHAAPHCDSRQFYRGILNDHSHAVFSGRIVVHEGAQKTDAKQTNMNLLLSDDALVHTKPQLEIYADDVKCTHGATVGQLDEDAVFYLKARGVPEKTARGLLTFAFVNEVTERMDLEPVRELLSGMLEERLPGMRRREAR